MSEPVRVLVVPITAPRVPGSEDPDTAADMEIGADTVAALNAGGIVVVAHAEPERVRLLHPEPPEISGSNLLRCAMRALASGDGTTLAARQRERFALEVAKAIEAGDA